MVPHKLYGCLRNYSNPEDDLLVSIFNMTSYPHASKKGRYVLSLYRRRIIFNLEYCKKCINSLIEWPFVSYQRNLLTAYATCVVEILSSGR